MIIVLFGKPGAGKSTCMAQFIQKNKRKKIKYYKKCSRSKLYKFLRPRLKNVFCRWLYNKKFKKNFYDYIYATDPTFQDTIPIDYEHLGMWKPTPNTCLILEEAGVGLSSRDFKKLSTYSKRFAAMHRHVEVDCLLGSQSCDIDKAWRQRAQTMFLVEKCFPFTEFSKLRRIIYSVDVDENTHDLVDAYSKMKGLAYLLEIFISAVFPTHRNAKFPFIRSRIIYRKPWYKYFDSFCDDFTYPMEDPLIDYFKNRDKKEMEIN